MQVTLSTHDRRKVLRWWQSLMLSQSEITTLNESLKDQGERPISVAPTIYKAQLKRCNSIDDAMMTEGFRALWLGLSASRSDESNPAPALERFAAIALILTHVKENSTHSLAKAAGTIGDHDKPIVSEIRFAQLQQAKTPDEFITRLRRIVKQLKGKVSVAGDEKTRGISEDVFRWFNEHYAFIPRQADKRIAVQWAMDYYNATSQK